MVNWRLRTMSALWVGNIAFFWCWVTSLDDINSHDKHNFIRLQPFHPLRVLNTVTVWL